MRAPATLILTLSLVGTAACGVSRGIRPLGEGVTAATASLGGPFADYAGAQAPLPLATVGVAHGVHERVDIHGAAHITTVALFALWGFEFGAGALLLDPDARAAPALMLDVNFNVFSGSLGGSDPEGGCASTPRPTCARHGPGARPTTSSTPDPRVSFRSKTSPRCRRGRWATSFEWGASI